MKRINLLTLGMVACTGLTAQAQIVNEDFNAEQTKQPTDPGYYKFVNVPPIDAEGASDVWQVLDGVLNISNDQNYLCENQKWQRGIKFFHLPIKPGKLYKVSFDIKAIETTQDAETMENNKPSNVDVKLMQGDENADICILGANGDEQRDNFSMNAGDEIHYSHTFFYADEAKQMAKYEEQCAGKPNYAPNEFFVNINVYNPGKFVVDNIMVEEVAVKSATFANNGEDGKIAIDFGKPTNINDLIKASEDPGTLIMPEGCLTVIDDAGEEVALDGVELRDGKLYIFGTGEIPAGATVKFTNPTDDAHKIVFLNDPEGSADFEIVPDENPGDSDLAAMKAWVYTIPEIASSTPGADSFNYPEDMKEFTFTFDHIVETAPIAITLDGNKLTLKDGTPAQARTVTAVYSGAALAKGNHTIEIEGVATEMSEEMTATINFEVGKHQVAKTIYEKITDGEIYVPGGFANNVPTGWTVVTNNEVRENNEGGYGSGGRAFDKPYGNVIYFRAAAGEEGSVTTTPVTLPAGPTQLRAYVAAWKAEGHDCNVQVVNAAGEVVAEQKVTGTSNAENGNNAFEFTEAKIDFEAVAGEYHLKFVDATLNGNGLAIKGGQFYSVTKTEGESVETETVAVMPGLTNDIMPDHGTGWKIYRPDGRMRDPGANGSWGGNDWTGGGGPRPQSSGMSGGIGGTAIYLAGNAYATYGEYDVQTDHNGPVEVEGETQPEKTLELDAARYQVTYYIGGWKNATETHNVKLEVFKFEDGITGTPVYTRTDDDKADENGNHNKAAANPTGKKINFFLDVPAAGKYILKFTAGGEGEGEALLGGVTVETTVSLPIQYAQMLDQALEPLVIEQGVAHENDAYKGETRDAIDAAVLTYSDPDFHTVAEYQEAIKNAGLLVKKMQTRRANIDAYPTSLEGVKAGLEAAQGTKYEALEQYPVVSAAYNKYAAIDYIALGDDELAEAVATMGDNGNLLKNMVEVCCPILTQQINDLVTAIVALDEEASSNEYVIAAGNAISDDQALVANLKKLYTAKLYKRFAEMEDPFHKTVTDPETMDEETIDIEYPVNFLIQNAEFYSKDACVIDGAIPDARNNFPGWNINVESGKVEPVWATTWGESYPTPIKPVDKNAVKSPWGASKYTVEQNIDNIPVALYDASIAVAHDDAGGDCYGYFGENQVKYEVESYARDTKFACVFESIAVPEVEETALGAIKIGAYMDTPSFSQVDDAKLQIVAKDPNFDYEAAAEKLGEEITAAQQIIAEQQPAGAPVKVAYFGLDGAQGAQTGVVIKVETWANGFQKITKMAK